MNMSMNTSRKRRVDWLDTRYSKRRKIEIPQTISYEEQMATAKREWHIEAQASLQERKEEERLIRKDHDDAVEKFGDHRVQELIQSNARFSAAKEVHKEMRNEAKQRVEAAVNKARIMVDSLPGKRKLMLSEATLYANRKIHRDLSALQQMHNTPMVDILFRHQIAIQATDQGGDPYTNLVRQMFENQLHFVEQSRCDAHRAIDGDIASKRDWCGSELDKLHQKVDQMIHEADVETEKCFDLSDFTCQMYCTASKAKALYCISMHREVDDDIRKVKERCEIAVAEMRGRYDAESTRRVRAYNKIFRVIKDRSRNSQEDTSVTQHERITHI